MMDCNCETKKASFVQSKAFLLIVTVFALLMAAFPLYARVFNPRPATEGSSLITMDNQKQVKFTIHGMTCAGCEVEINKELSKVKGIINYKTSYAGKSSLVTFDATKVDVKTIQAAIANTPYKIVKTEIIASQEQ